MPDSTGKSVPLIRQDCLALFSPSLPSWSAKRQGWAFLCWSACVCCPGPEAIRCMNRFDKQVDAASALASKNVYHGQNGSIAKRKERVALCFLYNALIIDFFSRSRYNPYSRQYRAACRQSGLRRMAARQSCMRIRAQGQPPCAPGFSVLFWRRSAKKGACGRMARRCPRAGILLGGTAAREAFHGWQGHFLHHHADLLSFG